MVELYVAICKNFGGFDVENIMLHLGQENNMPPNYPMPMSNDSGFQDTGKGPFIQSFHFKFLILQFHIQHRG